MMYRKDWNQRSPLRVFEKSTHGGLGKGNLGVVMSRAGIGKTAFLIGVALDDPMRERRVLHVSLGDPVERVREFYDAVFAELCRTTDLDDAHATHRNVERYRMIYTYPSGELSLEKLRRTAGFLKDHAHFEPEIVILDGVDFHNTTNADLEGLRELAASWDVELWMSAQTHRETPPTNKRRIADEVLRFDEYISVMVLLHDEDEGVVTVQLLKDHENTNVGDLRLRLDPTTLLLLTAEQVRLL